MLNLPDIVIVYEDKELLDYAPLDLYKTVSAIRLGMSTVEDFYSTLFASYGIEGFAFVEGENAKIGNIAPLLVDSEEKNYKNILLVPIGYIPFIHEIKDQFSCENENGRLMTLVNIDDKDDKDDKYEKDDKENITIQNLINTHRGSLTKPEGLIFSSLGDIVSINGAVIDFCAEYSIDESERRVDYFNIQCVGDAFKLYIHNETVIYPNVIFDTSEGPIVIDSGVVIMPGSFIEGPCYIGSNSFIDGARIYKNTSIFSDCKIMGRVENSIIYSNCTVGAFSHLSDTVISNDSNIGSLCRLGSSEDARNLLANEEDGNIYNDPDDQKTPIIGDYVRIDDGTIIPERTIVSFGSRINDRNGFLPDFIPPFIESPCEGVFDSYNIDDFIDYIIDRYEERGDKLPEELEDAIINFFEQTEQMRVNFLNYNDSDDENGE